MWVQNSDNLLRVIFLQAQFSGTPGMYPLMDIRSTLHIQKHCTLIDNKESRNTDVHFQGDKSFLQ